MVEIKWVIKMLGKEYKELVVYGGGESLENEMFLVESEMGLPKAYMLLEDCAKQVLMGYLESDLEEPYSGLKTKGNIFASYLMAYPNKKVLKSLFVETLVETGAYDKDGDPIQKVVKKVNPERFEVYTRLKQQSGAYWRKNNLKDLVRPMRDIIQQGGFKDEDILERAIIDDALSEDKSQFTARMRSLAVKVKGMEKTNSIQQINVYVEGGGKQLNNTIIEASGNDAYDLGLGDDED